MAEKKLTAQQVRFVEFYCSGMTAKDAYIKAGFKAKSDSSIRKQASQLVTNSNIRSAIDERLNEIKQNIDDQIKLATDDALSTMRNLLTSSMDFARFQAAKYLLDTAGHKAPEKHEHSGSLELGWKEIIYGTSKDNDDTETKGN